jgi:CheY-like chemotaxis protein
MNTILIVEDDLDTQELLSMFLGLSGYRASTANSREEALKILAKNKSCSLAIIDLRMPGMTLGDFMASAKTARPDVQYILTSAFPEDHAAKEARDHGIPYWLTKPFLPDELLKVVSEALT